jgi:hypothetical protein
MPAVGISPEIAVVTLFLLEEQKKDAHTRWRLGDLDTVTVTQYEKDLAYLTYHLKLPMETDKYRRLPESESMKILALIRTPVGYEVIRCTGCNGIAEINVPDPNERPDDMGNLRGMYVPCPSCKGQGWLGRKP